MAIVVVWPSPFHNFRSQTSEQATAQGSVWICEGEPEELPTQHACGDHFTGKDKGHFEEIGTGKSKVTQQCPTVSSKRESVGRVYIIV